MTLGTYKTSRQICHVRLVGWWGRSTGVDAGQAARAIDGAMEAETVGVEGRVSGPPARTSTAKPRSTLEASNLLGKLRVKSGLFGPFGE